MKHTLLAAACFLLLTACNNSTTTPNAPATSAPAAMATDMAAQNKKTVMAGMEALNAHDVDKVTAAAAPDFVDYGEGSTPPMKLDSTKKMIAEFLHSFPDVKGENQVYTAEGDRVIVTSDWTLTFKNDMGPVKATNKSFKYTDVDIFTFNASGKITSHRSIYPNAALMMMVGADMSKMKG